MSASFALSMSAKIDSDFRVEVFFLAEDEVAEGVLIRRPFFTGEPFLFDELCAVLEGVAFGPPEWVNLIFFIFETRGVLFGVPEMDDPFFLDASDFFMGDLLTALIHS